MSTEDQAHAYPDSQDEAQFEIDIVKVDNEAVLLQMGGY